MPSRNPPVFSAFAPRTKHPERWTCVIKNRTICYPLAAALGAKCKPSLGLCISRAVAQSGVDVKWRLSDVESHTCSSIHWFRCVRSAAAEMSERSRIKCCHWNATFTVASASVTRVQITIPVACMRLSRWVRTHQASSSSNAAQMDAHHNKRARKVSKRNASPVEEENAHVWRFSAGKMYLPTK